MDRRILAGIAAGAAIVSMLACSIGPVAATPTAAPKPAMAVITVNPTEGKPGDKISVEGAGWPTNSVASIFLQPPGQEYRMESGMISVDKQGGFTSAFYIPDNWQSGQAAIIVRTSSGVEVQARLTIAGATSTVTLTPIGAPAEERPTDTPTPLPTLPPTWTPTPTLLPTWTPTVTPTETLTPTETPTPTPYITEVHVSPQECVIPQCEMISVGWSGWLPPGSQISLDFEWEGTWSGLDKVNIRSDNNSGGEFRQFKPDPRWVGKAFRVRVFLSHGQVLLVPLPLTITTAP